MKIFLLAIACCLAFYSHSFGQQIKTARTFKAAFESSSQQNTPLMLIIHGAIVKNNLVQNYSIHPPLVYTNIRSEDLTERLNNNFVNYTTQSADSMLTSIYQDIEIKSFPVYLFFRPNKELYYRSYGYIRDKPAYMKMLDAADEAYKSKSIAELEKAYLTEPTNNDLIRKLIDKRKSLGYTNNATYIEMYATSLSVKDFNDYQTVLYVLEASPYADSKALKLAFLNKATIDSIFKTEPMSKRFELNGRIIRNTMNEAIKLKSQPMAQSAALFSRFSWTNEPEKGLRSQTSQLLRFYIETKDTLNYLRYAVPYYERNYMYLKTDSLIKLISNGSVSTSNLKKDSISNTLSNQSLSYSNDLDFASKMFYKTGTRNPAYLNQAIKWSKRAIEVNPFGSYYDTLAHLQYKAGKYVEAVENQQTAIKLIKKDKVNTAYFELELKKMKDKTL